VLPKGNLLITTADSVSRSAALVSSSGSASSSSSVGLCYSGLQKRCNVSQFQIVCSVVLYRMEITISIIERK
jgi:hypothetical protein